MCGNAALPSPLNLETPSMRSLGTSRSCCRGCERKATILSSGTHRFHGIPMKFCYYDESGDDGFPDYSSPLFVLTGVYFDHLEWKELHERVVELRRSLKERYGFPVKLEFHCNQFLLDKDPYRNLGYTHEQKIEIVSSICEFIGSLNLKIINILINKKAIEKFEFDVLKTALTYSIQRVENDLNPGRNPDARFLIITDEGRVAKMRNTTRAIQRINYIPSQYGGPALRREIKSLIEDPLPKDSKQSYFIQIADSVAYLVYLYGMRKLQIGEFPNRL